MCLSRDTREGYNYIQPPEPCSQRGPTKKRGKKKKKTEGGVSCLGLRRGWVALLHVFLKPKTKLPVSRPSEL